MFKPVADSVRASKRPDAAKMTVDMDRLPNRDIGHLMALDALIEAAGNTPEAFATAPLWYGLMDIELFNDIIWLRSELKPYIETMINLGHM